MNQPPRRTREPQYQSCIELRDSEGLTPLGPMSNETWRLDPRRLLFVLSRYKFAAKMLRGRRHVLEVGCADAFGTRVVLQEVERLTAVDFDPVFVDDVNQRMSPPWEFECRAHDMLEGPLEGPFDAAYALDVIEHIPADREATFVGNMAASLSHEGVMLLGSPSLASQQFASPASKAGHVNCKDEAGMRALLEPFFHSVFLFSMNDEVVHTGFGPMAHYHLALACHRK